MPNNPCAVCSCFPAKLIRVLILLAIDIWRPATVLAGDAGTPPASVAMRLQEILALPVPIEGAFVGSVHLNEVDIAVIVAGGATAVVPQDLSKSTLENRIYYCGPRAYEWKSAKLNSALAFGGAATADGAMYCVGGVGEAGLSDKIVKLEFEKGTLVTKDLARLPQPLAASGVAVMDDKLYVVGGLKRLSPMQASDLMWCIDLSNKDARWESLPLPDNGIISPAAGVRRDEIQVATSLIVVGGWCLDHGGILKPVSKAWKFLPKALVWSASEPGSARARDAGPAQAKVWTELADVPAGLAVVSAAPIGPSHLLVLANRLGKSPMGLASLLAHAGPPQLVNYHTYTDTWVDVPLTPHSASGTSTRPLGMAPMGNEIALLVSQGRSTLVYNGSFAYAERHFGIADYAVIFLYLLGILGIGHFFSRREKNTEDYFLGGRKIPWWAAGMSIWASLISAISTMAIPAKTYQQNWTYISLGLIPFFTTVIAAYVFVPMLRRLPVTTMMEYLELRFHYSYRIIATVLAVISQVAGRMAVTLLLPALALQAVSGMDIGGAARSVHVPALLADLLNGKDLYVCIIMMGCVATAYTVFGGIKAVVWTDVAQCLVMFSAAIMTFVYVIAGVDGGIAGTVKICLDHNKLRCFNGAFDLTVASVWIFMIWGVNDIYAKLDQIHMQRAFATDGAKSARRAMLTGGWISLPASLIFYATGSALFAYYHSHPGQLRPTLQTDSILPLFIVQHVPAGIAGLVIAGIFATGMNTLSASMNMVATVVVRDWYAFFDRQAEESTRMRTARLITFATGVLGTGMACWLAYLQIGSVWDTFSKLMGWLGGGFGCVGLLGMLTRRASTLGTLVGVIVSTLALIWVSLYTNLSFFAWGTFTLLVGCIVGYMASFVLPDRARNLDGLTVWTPKPQQVTT